MLTGKDSFLLRCLKKWPPYLTMTVQTLLKDKLAFVFVAVFLFCCSEINESMELSKDTNLKLVSAKTIFQETKQYLLFCVFVLHAFN